MRGGHAGGPERPIPPSVARRIGSRVISLTVATCLPLVVRASQIYQQTPFVPPPIYDSFQIRHVAIAALIHVLTLGYWPKTYGSDVRQVAPYLKGWTEDQLAMLTPHAHDAYLGWVHVWSIAIAVAIAAFGISALRKHMRASHRDTTHEGA